MGRIPALLLAAVLLLLLPLPATCTQHAPSQGVLVEDEALGISYEIVDTWREADAVDLRAFQKGLDAVTAQVPALDGLALQFEDFPVRFYRTPERAGFVLLYAEAEPSSSVLVVREA